MGCAEEYGRESVRKQKLKQRKDFWNWFTEISEKSRGHREARAANNIIDFGIGSLISQRSHGGHREDTIIIIIFNAEDAEKNKGRKESIKDYLNPLRNAKIQRLFLFSLTTTKNITILYLNV